MNDDQIIRPRLRFRLRCTHTQAQNIKTTVLPLSIHQCQTVACDVDIALPVTAFLGSPQAKCIIRIFTLLYILIGFLQDW